MIDLSRVIRDPRISQPKPFTVFRKTGSWQTGRWIEAESPVQLDGTITPASAKDLTQIPEGDRTGGELNILSLQPIYVTHADIADNNTPGTSDELLWNNERYRIYKVFPWRDFGFYHAIGIRIVSR